MAQNGSNWNSFMQDKPTRILLNLICTGFCGFYAVGAVMDLIRPNESTQMLAQQMGQTGFLVMTVARFLVLLWAAVTFARMAWKVFKEDDEA